MPRQQIELHGVASQTLYPGGQIENCKLSEPNEIEMVCGRLIPRWSKPDMRRKELKSLSFYRSGAVRSISLEKQTNIETSLGVFPAELVTFYEDGALESVFPLDGQIGFGWSEKDEFAFAEDVEFDFLFGSFCAKPVGLRFYNSGSLRSLILWPGERIILTTPAGNITVRIGFRLHENGTLESIEPAIPTAIQTPIGLVSVYDGNALGIDAELNSLRFDNRGILTQFSTSGDILVKNRETGQRQLFSSLPKRGISDDDIFKMPIVVKLSDDTVTLDDKKTNMTFQVNRCDYLFLPDFSGTTDRCSDGCESCSGCM